MRKLLWFSKIGGTSSFSRVSKSMLKELLLLGIYDITILSDEPYDNCKFIKIMQDCHIISYKEFIKSIPKERHLEMNMKYIIIQMIAEIEVNKPDTIVLLNGIYEADFYTALLRNAISSVGPKLMVWTPLDFKLGKEMAASIIQADIIATMSPNSVIDIQQFTKKKVHLLEHGYDLYNISSSSPASSPVVSSSSTDDIYKIINNVSYNQSCKLDKDDIVILNANNIVPRKQILLTVRAFLKLDKRGNIKLWIHTDLINMKKNTVLWNIVRENRSSIILTHNNLSDDQLRMIYKRCQIGLQTSTGEGFSLTNIEHAMYDGLQIVPDFLATGNHFKNDRGILIPVREIESVAEINNNKVWVAYMNLDDVVDCIEKAVNLVESCEQKDIVDRSKSYAKQFTWARIAEQFVKIESG
jgi:glycosyltransferase involved in cell wall biosynthesis